MTFSNLLPAALLAIGIYATFATALRYYLRSLLTRRTVDFPVTTEAVVPGDDLQKVPALIEKQDYRTALHLLKKYRHPVLYSLFPRVKPVSAKAGQQLQLKEAEIEALRRFIQTSFSNTVFFMSVFALAFILTALVALSLAQLHGLLTMICSPIALLFFVGFCVHLYPLLTSETYGTVK